MKGAATTSGPQDAFDPQVITAIRRKHKLTLKAFGEALGVSGPYISMIEAGKCRPSMVFLDRLSAVYGVRMASVFRKIKTP